MRFNVLVKEIMNKDVKKVSPDATVKEAATIMKNESIGSVIVDSDPMGIVTATDIVYNYVSDKKGETVKDVMTNNVIRISPNKTIEHAAKLMTERNIEKLPVFENDKLIGIITATDILSVEPALFETLLERIKMTGSPIREDNLDFAECESCGNYSDDVKEVEGVYMCKDCASSE
jgi:signal-transduction protein with cAMP-binding, CBS, and nucleotidyltransferase domain